MGYRLEISKIKNGKETYITSGNKLYGYVDVKRLKSWQWLHEHKGIDIEFWDYGINPRIILKPGEFEEFIDLYSEDYAQNYEEPKEIVKRFILDTEGIQRAINSNDYILLEWW